MASVKKRVEMKQQQKMTGNVQINTSVEDPQNAMSELIRFGVKNHEQRSKHFEKGRGRIPPTFYNQPKTKSRGSSVGHSREGSSDDGFGSSGRQTLSPSSISSTNVQTFGHYGQPIGVVHQRQASAPELVNYGGEQPHGHHPALHHHPHLPHHHGRFEGSVRSHVGAAGLPPIGNPHHNYSKSLSTAALATHNPNHYGQNSSIGLSQPIIHHQRAAKSCDFDAVHNNQNPSIIQQQNPNITGSMHHVPYTPQPTNGSPQYWNDPRAKSQSLDPLRIRMSSQDSLGHHQAQSLTAIPLNSADTPTGWEDRVGQSEMSAGWEETVEQSEVPTGWEDRQLELPAGWEKSCDPNTGEFYFIDHNRKITTWYDPRISQDVQAERMRQRFMKMKMNSREAFTGTNNDYGSSSQIPMNYSTPQYGTSQPPMDKIQDLQMEQQQMHERQQQLIQQGLLEVQQQSPHQTQQFGSPHMVPNHLYENPSMTPNYNALTPHEMEMYTTGFPQSQRTSSNDSALDNTMEVDFQNGMQSSFSQLDPEMVRDLSSGDLNPQEFDKYLRINETNQRLRQI